MKKFKAKILTNPKYKNGAYVVIPYDIEKLYGKKRLKVNATFDGIPYQGSIVKHGTPDYILIVKKDIREKLGKEEDDTLTVTFEEDTTPRVVEVPDFVKERFKKEKVWAFYEKLSYTYQKEYIHWIASAKKRKPACADWEKQCS